MRLLPWQHEWKMKSRRDVRPTIDDGREKTGERKYGSDILGICEVKVRKTQTNNI